MKKEFRRLPAAVQRRFALAAACRQEAAKARGKRATELNERANALVKAGRRHLSQTR